MTTMKVRRVLGLAVLLGLLVSACDAPEPEVHQLVTLTWGSVVRPSFSDIGYGPERGCSSGSDELCGGSQELDIYRVRAGGNRGTLVYIYGGGYVTGDKYLLGDIGNIKRQLHRGYSIVSINHRLPPIERDANGDPVLVRAGPIGWPFPQGMGENGFRPAMADVAAALNWICERGPDYGLSTGTVAVMGSRCSRRCPPSMRGWQFRPRSTGTRSLTAPAGVLDGRPVRVGPAPVEPGHSFRSGRSPRLSPVRGQ